MEEGSGGKERITALLMPPFNPLWWWCLGDWTQNLTHDWKILYYWATTVALTHFNSIHDLSIQPLRPNLLILLYWQHLNFGGKISNGNVSQGGYWWVWKTKHLFSYCFLNCINSFDFFKNGRVFCQYVCMSVPHTYLVLLEPKEVMVLSESWVTESCEHHVGAGIGSGFSGRMADKCS